MSDQDKQEAAELAQRAKEQGKHAAKNTGRAIKAAAEPAAEAVVDEAKDIVHKAEGTAEDLAQTAKRLDVKVLTALTSDTGQGFLMLSVAMWAGTIAANKFRGVYAGRKALVAARATRPID